jgi:hypothetical protein
MMRSWSTPVMARTNGDFEKLMTIRGGCPFKPGAWRIKFVYFTIAGLNCASDHDQKG